MIFNIIKKLYFRIFSKFESKIILLLAILVLFEYIANLIFTEYVFDYLQPKHATKYVVNIENCKIKDVEYFYNGIEPYTDLDADVSCGDKLPLVVQNETHLIIYETAFPDYGIISKEDVNCDFYYFWRKEPQESENDHQVIRGDIIAFENGTAKITHEFVRVNCTYSTRKELLSLAEDENIFNYTDYFAFVVINEKNIPKSSNKNSKYNVLIIGLDSVSRLNFHRQMPLTFEYITEKLNAIEFFGYTKLGSNTFPNLIPVFTGQSVEEIRKSCWPSDFSRFDNCSFIWNDYHKAGYVTAFAEELNVFGLFNYLKFGFIKQPVTHMWGVFEYLASEEIGIKHLREAKCIGDRLNYLNLLEYTMRFIQIYSNIGKNYFGTFWESSISHNSINYGRDFDYFYMAFFASIYSKGYFNNTIIFLMSDHGYNMESFISIESRLENRLPLFFAIIPPNFDKKHPQPYINLKENSRKLTSHWDLHATLKAIVEDDFGDDFEPNRGISIFKPIPNDRSCESAGIVPHWCTCSYATSVSTNHASVQLAAKIAVNYINKLLENYTECIELVFDKVLDATASRDTSRKIKIIKPTYITVTFQTKISLGIFEATVSCYTCDNLEDYILEGPVSRQNIYDNQSICIYNAFMQPYCYCKNLLKYSQPSFINLPFRALDFIKQNIKYYYNVLENKHLK